MSRELSEQYTSFVEILNYEDQRCSTLNNIKTLMEMQPALEAGPIILNYGIPKIIKCLDTSDRPLIELTAEVLKICFEKLEPGDVIKKYLSHFMYLLRHKVVSVRLLAATEVYKAVTEGPDVLPASQYVDVFVAAGYMVSNKDIGLASKAVSISSNLPADAYPRVLEELKIVLEYTNRSRCNILQVVVNISSKSHELFKLCIEHEYIDYMISELDTDDFLYQINILDLLSQLAIKPYGMNHLVECGALDNIVDMISDLEHNPMKNLLIPGYMRFFGSVAYHYPKEILSKYPILMDSLFSSLESDEPVILLIALDTLGLIGTTIEGKMCLAALGSDYIMAIERVCKFVRNSSSVIKVRASYCLASLIAIEHDRTKTVDQRITLMTREWFRSLSKEKDSTTIVFEICKNPFSDIKLAGFELLDAICQHRWGEEMVAGVAGFIEYLLDRPTDFNKEEQETKYKIVKRLSKSPVFDANIISRLQTYVKQGPFFTEPFMHVATEEGD